MSKKKGPVIKKGLDEWMATYSDMITLLFCFFVLLYATSTQDETKMQYILQAIKPEGKYINTVVGLEPEEEHHNNDDKGSEVPMEQEGDKVGFSPGITVSAHLMELLYSELEQVIQTEDLSDAMQVSATPGMIRIALTGDIWFDADSYILKEEGVRALGLVYPAIKAVQEYILNVQIQGHTADVGSDSGQNDWELSSMRAVSVLKFLDFREMVESRKFRSEGFAQYRPAGDNQTEEGRAMNRRVEIVINRDPSMEKEVERYINDIMTYDYHVGHKSVNYQEEENAPAGKPIDTIVEGILDDLNNKYADFPEGTFGPDDSSGSGLSAGGLGYVSEDDYEPPEEKEAPPRAEAETDTNGDE